jgi:hypothetical protein
MNPKNCQNCKLYPCEVLVKQSETIDNKSLGIAMRGAYEEFISHVGCDSCDERYKVK